jgi:hypothetical protein
MLSPFVRWAGAKILNNTKYLAMPCYVLNSNNLYISEWRKLLRLRGLNELYVDVEHIKFNGNNVEKVKRIEGMVEDDLATYVFLQPIQFGRNVKVLYLLEVLQFLSY